MSALRNAALARVHIARKEMALDEDGYRAVLRRVTGHESAGRCSDSQLGAVLDEFQRLGWTAAKRHPRPSEKPHVRLIWALWAELRGRLRDPSPAALRSFVRRQTGVADPEWLDAAEANSVIEALKAWLAREPARTP